MFLGKGTKLYMTDMLQFTKEMTELQKAQVI